MNQLIWGAIREYVQAEVKLAVAELRYKDWPDNLKDGELEPLRLNVTRFETEVRRLTDAHVERLEQIAATAIEAQSHHVRY